MLHLQITFSAGGRRFPGTEGSISKQSPVVGETSQPFFIKLYGESYER